MNQVNNVSSVEYDEDDKLQEVFIKGVRLAIEKKKLKNLPVSRYDRERKCTYLEYPDGTKKYEDEQ